MKRKNQDDLYGLLGVPPTATIEELKTAYRAKVQESHPDRHDGSQYAQDLTARLIAAYKRLKDPETRRRYDTQRNRQLRDQRRRAPVEPHGHGRMQPRVPAVRSRATASLSLPADPVVGPEHASRRAGGGGWALLLGIGGLVAGAVVLANKNGYDGNVCRYRDRGGQFRKGPFF